MKSIEIDDDLYTYIASQTKHIGEGASQILRRLLLGDENAAVPATAPNEEEAVASIEVSAAPAANQPIAAEPKAGAEAKIPAGDDVFAILDAMKTGEQTSRVELFLSILAAMHKANPSTFNKVLRVRGRNRLYFGASKAQLLEAGSSTNPKQIPGSEFWVVTNNNTAKKESMLSEVAEVLGYSSQQAQKLLEAFGS